MKPAMRMYFSDFFGVTKAALNKYGAFDISLLADLPLFVDPFLLFNSKKPKYRTLHDGIIEYLRFLKEKSAADQDLDADLLDAWYRFPEVGQNWLGFSAKGNSGHGLGKKFAGALHTNLGRIFGTFGAENVTRGSHLEKLCLIREGVGRDNISDFTNNLIHEYLLEYTQAFALRHIDPSLRRKVAVRKVRFNYDTESWETASFDLPWYLDDFVLLTPKDILTKDETWINKTELVERFESIPEAIPNAQLRGQISNYFRKMLPRKPSRKDERDAAFQTIQRFPELVDFYIKRKEDTGDQAESIASQRVQFSQQLYLEQFRELAELLQRKTAFYATPGTSYADAYQRVQFFKDVIENKGGQRIFYIDGKPLEREEDLHILYRLTWFATPSVVTREANDGRGPVDFLVSQGPADKTLVEFKLAKNSQLERNLKNQTPVYEKASDAETSIKVIVYFSVAERRRVEGILKNLKMDGDKNVILVDARKDNKPSGSKA
ncbi:MAG: hypothetical protein P4K98_04265 [Bryobacteraceae bacterium]|nr:hypothetical protein [Bryobacteraceae bacterium]